MPPVSPPGSVESEACDEVCGFRVWTSGENRWHLAGEADLSADSALRAAMLTASVSRCGLVLDCGELSFIDVSGLRVIALAALALGSPVVVNGANEMLRRAWSLLDLHVAAPNVEFST
ncbi:STAS domain-containing protein [Actinocrinis sp.]|jgi:anti-anti-sigma factor|uniref:STAS domain-containing protein n=1 Tax=Actinocrinis sp. TaxID=1920516 RepID=UPI002C793CFA|nr:STAS domain-containing protein [Actinocrinis sp.]HXR71526.1 STAS domain-containing protein [Actinocrinis sp.]